MKTKPPLRLLRSLLVLLIVLHAEPFVQAQQSGIPLETADAATLELGRKVYEAKCISCHGPNGIGTPEVPSPIFGDRANADLTDLISRTMPEGAPEDCVGEEAEAVALWMQQTFYSPEAQARLNPPRVELSRLTVSQYRNAVADLATSFRWFNPPKQDRGLKAEYYASRNFRRDRQIVERHDARVDFNFGASSPDWEKMNEDEFSIQWNGSLIPRESGSYEFIVRTENGARLFVNDDQNPLIDAWVRSGSDREFKGSAYLLAGRIYRLRLEWFKFKEPTASVALLWKPPGGVQEVIPTAQLTPDWSPRVFVVETPFPPDDRSSGYERGTSVSKEWDEATTNAAIEMADKFVENLRDVVDLKDGDRTEKIKEFAGQFVERAFRRPLTDELKKIYLDDQFAAAATPEEGLRRIILLTLKSPRFLYREPAGQGDQFDRASRLSFALLNSIPDKALFEAAKNGHLETEKQVRDQAWRLVSDYRSRSRMLEFLRNWMNLDRLHDLSKNKHVYPDFTPEIAADLRVSLEMLLEHSLDADNADFRRLLLSDSMYLNGRLSDFYKAGLPASAEFQEVQFEPERRSGIITHPFLLSGFAYMETSSPIHRGVFLSRGVLGRGVKPPPIAVAPTAPDLAPDLTTRERVTEQTKPDMCVNCHGLINSLGFALENFDSVGRFRDIEKSKPIDAKGHYQQRTGETIKFSNAKELASFLARSEETHRSFVRQLFHHMVQQPILAYGSESIGDLSRFFKDHEFHMKHLMVEIACRSALQTNSGADQPAVATSSNPKQ
jgi:cytochrome c5